jgi:glycosyl transferase, family 25
VRHLFALLNEYYDHVYVLSVKAATDRRERFKRLFDGLEYSFYYGADKNAFTIDELRSKGVYDEVLTKKHHRYNKSMKAGEIACAWSHKMMYEDVLSKNFERVLIFEDDAVPDPSAINNVPDIINEIPAYCELLFWGWGKNGENNFGTSVKQKLYHLQHSFGQLKWDHKMISNLYARSYSKHLKIAGFHDYTYAYAITASGARKLLAMQQPLQYIADNLLSIASTKDIVKAFITYPAVFLHDELPDGRARDSYIR